MCANTGSVVRTAGSSEESETVTLTISQLEDLVEAAIPPLSESLAALSRLKEPQFGPLFEICTPCVAGYKLCTKCSWFGCKVRVRKC